MTASLKDTVEVIKKSIFTSGVDHAVTFGSSVLILQILPYILCRYQDDHYILLIFRILSGGALSIVIFQEYLFRFYQKYLPLFWSVTLGLCLVITPTLVFLLNPSLPFWLMHMIFSFFLLTLLLDWKGTLFMSILGLLIAFGIYSLSHHSSLQIERDIIFSMFYAAVFFSLIIMVFVRNKNKIEQKKIESYEALSGYIAHEMYTPLATLDFASENLLRCLKKISSSSSPINTPALKEIEKVGDSIKKTLRKSFNLLDFLRITLKKHQDVSFSEKVNIVETIQEVLEDYPLSPRQRTLITTEFPLDFQCSMDKTLLSHIFSNLIKNALYAIHEKGKGRILIQTIQKENFGVVLFSDTAKGIPPEDLPYIFNKFFSKKRNGMGLGLSFCKERLEEIGGRITCTSVYGSYTEFMLFFPLFKHEETK